MNIFNVLFLFSEALIELYKRIERIELRLNNCETCRNTLKDVFLQDDKGE